jgi:hypothetical protein
MVGMESMSQAPHLSRTARTGARFGNLVFTDAIQSVRSTVVSASRCFLER